MPQVERGVWRPHAQATDAEVDKALLSLGLGIPAQPVDFDCITTFLTVPPALPSLGSRSVPRDTLPQINFRSALNHVVSFLAHALLGDTLLLAASFFLSSLVRCLPGFLP